MTTPRVRTIVSLVGMMTVTLVPGGCAGGASRPGVERPTTPERRLTIRFDNDAREHVHVYLIADQREWLLGRVEPGAVATLRFPEAALAGSTTFVRLAVVTGERVTLRAAHDPRARFTVAQPASAILSHQWWFGQGQLTPLPLAAPDLLG